MTKIGFIGVGHMGAPMAQNLLKKGFKVSVFDISASAILPLVELGAIKCQSAVEAATKQDFVITMLPESKHVQHVYLGENGLLKCVPSQAFFIDCSTIDPDISFNLHEQAQKMGHYMLDAPVSGGVVGATQGSLTFMVGGQESDFQKAVSVFEAMGKNIFHAGSCGHGQGMKTCNNLMLGINMIATCEAFVLGEKLGLDKKKQFEIIAHSSGQNWCLTSYCPVPDVLPTSPANHGYRPGFTSAMMLKDLRQAQAAAQSLGLKIPLGEVAQYMYEQFCREGADQMDFSSIIEYLRNLS